MILPCVPLSPSLLPVVSRLYILTSPWSVFRNGWINFLLWVLSCVVDKAGVVGGAAFYLSTHIWYQMPLFKCKQNIFCQMKTKPVKQRPGTQGLPDVQKLLFFFFFCYELLSKPGIHESKKEPWFTSRALGEYRWQKDLKFWSSCFRNMASEINHSHSSAARELLHWSCSFWTWAGCATPESPAAGTGQTPSPSWLVPAAVRLLLSSAIDHLAGKWEDN